MKLSMTANEEERKKIREHINREKKRSIQLFLQEVNEKRDTFVNQRKKHFKEDFRKDIIEGNYRAFQSKNEEGSTMSDDHQNSGGSLTRIPGGRISTSKIREELQIKERQQNMAKYMNGKGDRRSNHNN